MRRIRMYVPRQALGFFNPGSDFGPNLSWLAPPAPAVPVAPTFGKPAVVAPIAPAVAKPVVVPVEIVPVPVTGATAAAVEAARAALAARTAAALTGREKSDVVVAPSVTAAEAATAPLQSVIDEIARTQDLPITARDKRPGADPTPRVINDPQAKAEELLQKAMQEGLDKSNTASQLTGGGGIPSWVYLAGAAGLVGLIILKKRKRGKK